MFQGRGKNTNYLHKTSKEFCYDIIITSGKFAWRTTITLNSFLYLSLFFLNLESAQGVSSRKFSQRLP